MAPLHGIPDQEEVAAQAGGPPSSVGRAVLDAEGRSVDLGGRIRDLRRLRRCTLRVIAERTGLTEGFISQIERGRANPSLASVQRIAQALGVEIVELFDPHWQPRPTVLHRDDRPALREDEGVVWTLLTPLPFPGFEVIGGEFDVGASTRDAQLAAEDSEALLVVLSGSMVLHLGGDVLAMPAGSSIRYETKVPHRVVNVGDGPAEVLWIVSPPLRR
jgi:transcriptional regulator with XRE-family HTH domain